MRFARMVLAASFALAACVSPGSSDSGSSGSTSGTGATTSTPGSGVTSGSASGSGSSSSGSSTGASGSSGCMEGPNGSATVTGGPPLAPIYVVARPGFELVIADSIDCGPNESVQSYELTMLTADGGPPPAGSYAIGANDAGFVEVLFHQGTWGGDGLSLAAQSGAVQLGAVDDAGVRGSFDARFAGVSPMPNGGAEVRATFSASWRR